jgi:methyl-accepting chemotaxis protein
VKLRMNIRKKLLIPTIMVIVAGASVLSIISYTKSKNAVNDAILDNIQQRVESTVTTLQTWLKDRTLDMASWSREEIYAKAVKDSFVGKAARVAANEKMARLQTDYNYYEDIALADRDGLVIAASAEKIVGKIKVADREYFKAAMAGNVFVSDVAKSRNSGNAVFFIAAPIMEKSDTAGVLFGVVSIESFSHKFIDPIKVGKSGYAFLFDQTGMVLAYPEKANILKLNMNDLEFGKKMIEQKNGLLNYVDEGVAKLSCFKTLEGLDWTIVINVPQDEIFASARSLGRINLIVSLVVVVIAAFVVYLLTSSVVNPLNRVVAGLKDAAQGQGDLTKRIEAASKDEVGELAHWFNTFVEKIQRIIANVAQNATNLSNSSKELADISDLLSEGAGQTSGKAVTVAAASEEMSTAIANVAQVMEETASNLAIVAAGAEEMTATINEITVNTEKGRQIAEEAVDQTTHASEQIEELGAAAQQIGKVVETITEISEQVNLLALNATIEAARAGESGKGFAVVANEIKDLARQTAAASGEIKQQVEGIQDSTQGTVEEIARIAAVVAKVNEIVATIATALEEQSVTTKDIAGNVARASEGITEVNRSVAETSRAAASITVDITDVTHASGEISNSSAQVNASSSDLSKLAEMLTSMVGQFKI